MSFFKKTLASFGIGSAKVDSVLQQEVLIPGQNVDIKIHVYGGSSEQEIDNIDLKLFCRYVREVPVDNEDNDEYEGGQTEKQNVKYELASWQLPYAFTIEPGEDRTFDVNLPIPWNTPVTIGDANVWLETGLDISMAIDPTDKDTLTVRPDPLMDGIFTALEEQGLRIRQVECEEADGFALPFVQEFEFVPTTGPYHGRWRELEIVAYRDEGELQLWFEVDRQKKGIGGMLAGLIGGNELNRHLVLTSNMSGDEAGQAVLAFLESST
jgi:sporulation-control protein